MNLKIGDCECYLDLGDGNGEQFLGQTKGGSKVMIDRKWTDLTVDKYGETPVDKVLIGQHATIIMNLAEATTRNLKFVLPEGLYAQSPAYPATATDNKIGIGRTSGFLLSSVAGQLRLHPRKNSPSSRDEDIYLFKTASFEKVELDFSVDNQRIVQMTCEALVDETQPDGQVLGRIGDAAIS